MRNLSLISRQPFFVPENKNIDELLKDFRAKKTNVAIVVDEWGGTSGLITLEDIVEEVLGEIQDPYDTDKSLIFKQKDSSMIIDGKITIYDLQEEIEIDFPEDREYDTLAGFILDSIGDIPVIEQSINYIFKQSNTKYILTSVVSCFNIAITLMRTGLCNLF